MREAALDVGELRHIGGRRVRAEQAPQREGCRLQNNLLCCSVTCSEAAVTPAIQMSSSNSLGAKVSLHLQPLSMLPVLT